MKLTTGQLRALVREELAHPRSGLGTNIADVEFPIVVGYDGKSEIAYDQDGLDDILDDITRDGTAYSLDSLEDMEPRDVPVGAAIEQFGESMKITKRQLRRIVKEERYRILNEGSLQSSEENADKALVELMDAYLDQHLDLSGSNRDDALDRAFSDLRNFVEGLIETTKDFEAMIEPER